MSKVTRVFIVQDPGEKDISSSEKFGRHTIILRGDELVIEAFPKLENFLSSFDPEKDYLLPIGSLVNVLLAGYVLSLYVDSAKILSWDKESRQYVLEEFHDTESINESANI